MSNYTTSIPNYLVDSTDAVVGLVGPDGREWVFPTTLAVAADGASFLGFTKVLFDSTGAPVGYLAYGREFLFGSAFTANTTRGLRTRARPTLMAAGGQPIGVRSGAQSWVFGTPPVENSSGAAGLNYLGQVATRSFTPNNLDSTNNSVNSRTAHYATQDITSLQFEFPGFYVLAGVAGNGSDSLDKGTTGVCTYTAAVEYPAGTFTQIKWAGATSKTAPNVVTGANIATTGPSDTTAVAIPKGSKFWVRSYCVTPGATGGGLPMLLSPTATTYADDSAAFSASAQTDVTMGGTITDSGANAQIFPCAIIAQTTQAAAALIGDSRTIGTTSGGGTGPDANGNQGQSARQLGTKYAYINMGVGSTTVWKFNIGAEQRQRLARLYASHVVFGYGINDVGSGIGNRPSTKVIADIQSFARMFPTKAIIPYTISAFTTGTYTSEATQTADTNVAAFSAVNAYLKTNPAPFKTTFDLAAITNGVDQTKWAAPGGVASTSDGLHANQAMTTTVMNNSTPDVLMAYTATNQYSMVALAPNQVLSFDVANPSTGQVATPLQASTQRGTFGGGGPTYSATSFNGGPGVTYNGTSNASLGDTNVNALFATAVPGFTLTWLGQIVSLPSGQKGLVCCAGSTAAIPRVVLTVDNLGNPGALTRRLDGDATIALTGSGVTLAASSIALIVASFDAANNAITVRCNGITVATGVYPVAGNFSGQAPNISAIGAFNSQFTASVLREYNIIARGTTLAEMQKLEGDIAWRQGVNTIVLSPGHPYYNAAPTTN